MKTATTTNRTVRYVPSAILDHCGEMIVTRGSTVTTYGISEIVGLSPRKWLVARIRTDGPDTASNRAAQSRIDTYTCTPGSKSCTCAAGNIALSRGRDSECVHVLALSKLIQIGALPDPLERPSDVSNTEIDEQEPDDCCDPWDMVLDSGYVAIDTTSH